MEIVSALLVGSLVGWYSPLFGRGVGGPFVDMAIGAAGGFFGVAINLLVHADNNLMVVFGAALLLAVVGWARGRVTVAPRPPAQ